MRIGKAVLTKLALASAALVMSVAAQAEQRDFKIPPGDLQTAIKAFVAQCNCQLIYKTDDLNGLKTDGVSGQLEPGAALEHLIAGSGLKAARDASGAMLLFAPGTKIGGVPGSDGIAVLETVEVRGEGLHLGDTARTGTRIDVDPMELPQSVSSVTGSVLAQQQAKNLSDALSNFSGISDMGDGLYATRGFYAGVARNGELLASGQSYDAPMLTVSRIEVVKGPDAIVAGLAAGYGGVINVISKTPETKKILDTVASFGSNGYYDVGMDANTPVNDDKTLLVRLVVDKQGAGTTQNGYDGESKKYFGPSVTWKNKGTGTDFTLSYEYQAGNEPPPLNVYTDTGYLSKSLQPFDVPPSNQGNREVSKITTLAIAQKLSDEWSLGLKYSDNNTTFDSLLTTSYLGSIFGFFDNSVVIGDTSLTTGRQETKNAKVELRGKFSTGDVDHQMLVAYDNIQQIYDFFGSATGLYSVDVATGVSTDITSTWGPFFGIGMPMTGSHTVSKETGGLVMDHIVWGKWAALVGLRRVHYEPDSQSQGLVFNANLPSFGIVYRYTPEISLYTSVAKGFQTNSGFFQYNGSQVAPENAVQTEGGVKWLMNRSRLALTVSLFDIVQHNVAVTDVAHPTGCVGGTCWIDVAGVKTHGIEFEFSGNLTPRLEIRTNYSYTDKHSENPAASGIYYAHDTANLWLTYHFWGPEAAGYWAAMGLQGRSARNYDVNSATNPGNSRLDLNVGYDAKKWNIVAGVKNVTDHRLYNVASGFFGTATMQQTRQFFTTAQMSFF